MNIQELFNQVPNKTKPVNPTAEYALQWTLTRFREVDYQYLEVELSAKVAHEVVKALRAQLEPKGYRVSIRLSRTSFYTLTIE